jgi:fused signal recognition particle receptor
LLFFFTFLKAAKWSMTTSWVGSSFYFLKMCQILMAAGDTFRAAASDQLEIWAERTGCEIVVAERDKAKAASGRQLK